MLKSTSYSKYKTFCQIALACYWIALIIATHLPPGTSLLPPEENNIDKVYHFAAYTILAWLLATVWQHAAGVLNVRHLVWAWVAVAVFGVLDEITQIPFGRDCEFWDWAADITGAAVGLTLFACLRRLIGPRATTPE